MRILVAIWRLSDKGWREDMAASGPVDFQIVQILPLKDLRQIILLQKRVRERY